MSTPGIADPYWFEWYVGIENIVNMINPDNGISYVIFQCAAYETIDDIVVGYNNGEQEICYQIKHQVATSSKSNFTFGKLLEKEVDKKHCLISAMALGWKEAKTSAGHPITPILYTNRRIGENKVKRTFKGTQYTAYPIDKYFTLLKKELNREANPINIGLEDEDLKNQWDEMCSAIDIPDIYTVVEFIQSFELRGNQLGLDEFEQGLITSIAQTFSCSDSLATELFNRLVSALKIWTTTRRTSQKVTIEDVYSVLGTDVDVESSQHRLAPPYPFFLSRERFCLQLENQLKDTNKKIVFISGDPGSGKTSIISYIQARTNLFLLRYHTFRPISPEQRFYNTDEGICTPENLWGTLLIQLRQTFKGRLAQYKVPLNNHFCTIEEMRNQSRRLLGILAKEAALYQRKVFVCIDGIDHAARAKNNLSFLSSLFLPEEVPLGVCFVIVGQPADMYQAQYPSWLIVSDEVEHIEVPKINTDDIIQLIRNRAPQFDDKIEGIATLVFQYTQGNNLSTVFAVEELRGLTSNEDVIACIKRSGISADIHQYYQHIWNFVKQELVAIGLGIPYPESIIACPILLMNGRVDIKVLANALPYKLTEADWHQIFAKLYPLVVPRSNNEFALFHNDFRVFLMGIINGYQPKYREIALQLAEYLYYNGDGLIKYIMTIPLLCSANQKNIIPRFFTPDFVLGALAEGVSKSRLDEYAQLSYDEACRAQDEALFCRTYLSIKTLYQHEQYYEYYGRTYISSDHPELGSIDISEIRVVPITNENLNEYSKALTLCINLHENGNPEYVLRAVSLYGKWFGKLKPKAFLALCEANISEEDAWELRTSETGLFLEQWGTTAAKLKKSIPSLDEATSNKEVVANICFGNAYFNACFEQEEYDHAIEALDNGYVSKDCFENKLDVIHYKNLAQHFSYYLLRTAENSKDLSVRLFAAAILALRGCETSFSEETMFSFEPIKHVYDETSFSIVLYAFLTGCSECALDESVVCGHAKSIYQELKAKEKELEQITKMVRLACLLGKYHMQPTDVPSDALKRHVKWFLTTKLWRRFDYSKAYKFLLFAILNTRECGALTLYGNLIPDLETCLFEIESLGMYYKTYILDFLNEHKYLQIIKKYIICLYGEDGSRIFQNENYAEMHDLFCPYGEIVLPQIMRIVSDKLKWDVVAYTEYSMQGSSEAFAVLAMIEPSVWKDCGQHLYRQLLVAKTANNKYEYDIKKSIANAAIQCGLTDFWTFHCWDEDLRMDPELLYDSIFELIETARTAEDLVAIWILSCGIHSWYTQDGRLGSKCIYEACNRTAAIMDMDFSEVVSAFTPEWFAIIQHELRTLDFQHQLDSYSRKITQEKEQILAEYMALEIDDLLNELSQIIHLSHAVERFSIVLKRLCTEQLQNDNICKELLINFCRYLKGKSWTYEQVDDLIKSLLFILGEEAFWSFARTLGENLSEYSYQTAVRNMQLLLKLYYGKDVDKARMLFEQELFTQKMWVTGNNHIKINDELSPASTQFPAPNSYSEMSLYLLLEQIDTQNGRKVESAIYGIYKLGRRFSNTLETIAQRWNVLSKFQKDIMLIAVSRWSNEKVDGFKDVYDMLLKEYEICNSLERKYFLHSILRLYMPDDAKNMGIDLTAAPVECQFPVEGVSEPEGSFERFLKLSEDWMNQPHINDDIRMFIGELNLKESYKDDRFSRQGDCTVPNFNERISQALYGEEKRGRWNNIPLVIKKCWLLQADDPFMATEMPAVVYDDEWFPNDLPDINKQSQTIIKAHLSQVIHRNCGANEQVMGACVWYPWGHDEGTIYYEIAKIDAGAFSLVRNNSVERCLGNFGLLFQEGPIDEMGSDSVYQEGISLFKLVGGGMRFYHCNCQIAPSNIWRDTFQCTPEETSPYNWIDETGKIVLWFERIASPMREAMHEKYYRQPILFRWVCKSDWLQTELNARRLRVRYVSTVQPLP